MKVVEIVLEKRLHGLVTECNSALCLRGEQLLLCGLRESFYSAPRSVGMGNE